MNMGELGGKYPRLVLGKDTDSHGTAMAHLFLAPWIDRLAQGRTDRKTVQEIVEETLDLNLKAVRRKRRPLTGYTRKSNLEEIQVYTRFLVDLGSIQD